MHLWSAVSGWINWPTEASERGIGPYQDMDTISMLLTGWIIFILISIVVVKYLYFRFVKKTGFPQFESSSSESRANLLSHEGGDVGGGAGPPEQNGSVGDLALKAARSSPKPQPPARRRHKLAGAPQTSPSHDHATEGVCTGPDPAAVEFIKQIYDWAFKKDGKDRASWVGDIKSSFMTALNQVLRDEGGKQNDFLITIIDLNLKEDLKLYNMFAECIHPDNVKVTSDCELQLQGQVTLHQKQQLPRRLPFFVDHISGRLSILVNTSADKSALVKLDGWPEICVAVSFEQDKGAAQIVGDAIASAIRNCLTELSYAQFAQFPVAPKFSPRKDGLPQEVRYLLATIVRGRELGVQKGCQEAYCAIELDDPPQKFQTDIVRSHDPVWNENFVFNILPRGGELLFEVYDKVGARFLGCNIISVDDMKTGGPEGRYETLKLISRKLEDSEGYTGSIDVQFTPLSEPEFLQRSAKNKRQQLLTTTRRVFTPSPDSKSSAAAFAENVIRELGKDSSFTCTPTSASNTNTISTLIIHAVVQKRDRANGDDPSEAIAITQYGDERGRRKTRKGDIFTSIRRRFSKGRSHSVMGEGGTKDASMADKDADDVTLQRSISADRHSMASTSNNLRLGLGSARSSTSELSGISGFSTTTFVHENSTLVIECVENRVKKYFLVPPNLAESGRYRKKGKKLHIYNDHTFLAKHLPSGTMCEICTMRLPFSIGKQGYQCRDCNMMCHKECHVRAPSFCPKTTIYDIELSSVKQLETTRTSNSSGLFSSLFRRGNKVSGVAAPPTNTNPKTTAKGVDSADQTNNAFTSENNASTTALGDGNAKPKKKKSNIFRKATRLGKISEENLSPSTKEVEETEEDEPLPENATIADTNVLAEEQTPENKQLLEGPEQQVS
ncbi:uncharacterized protein LOC110859330 isoform X3 [Folsomia candida]|uniref:Protein kinase C-like 3 n=1 Tax=Folsomia candida TaxID=158441 RepID=A0A226DAM7_FOLCA|nr:uncharacterized protein LOC110859330 isoform X3 [Folsomia candida]OXA42605.1 Protein kinase C-like 3 [Folsomia candida]